MGQVARELRLHGNLPAPLATSVSAGLNDILNVKMTDAADVAGTTQTVSFQITDFESRDFAAEVVLEFAVFRDADLSTPATGAGSPNGTLGTATKGSFVAGEGTAATLVKTDTNGAFECTLTLTTGTPGTLFIGCRPSFKSPMLDCREFDSVSFT